MNGSTRDQHDPSSLNDPRPVEEVLTGPAMSPFDGDRPFGVHIRMARWKSIILIALLVVTLVATQFGGYLVVGLIEGGDPFASTLTPMKLLAVNVSTGLTALLAVALVAWFAKVPWRAVFSAPRRFDRRRLAVYFLGSIVLVGIAMAIVGLTAPDAVGWTGLSITSTTIALLVVTVLSAPLQTAGEEIMFRGAILPAAGSWFRSAKAALIFGMVVSTLAFAFLHGSSDPMLFGYYVVLSAGTVAMGVMTRGLEAAIAFHTANNLITTSLNSLLSGGGAVAVERSEGSAGGFVLLLPAAASVAAVIMVALRERARRASERA